MRFSNFDGNTDDDEAADQPQRTGRNVWMHLDMLMSFAEKYTGDAYHDDARSLLWAVNYLQDLESTVQKELDFAIISLKEFWRYSYSDIADALGTKWEHDRSHLLVAVPDNELGIKWTEAQRRYRAALKRQFGADTEVPVDEFLEMFNEEILWRKKATDAIEFSAAPPRPETDPQAERDNANLLRRNRVLQMLRRDSSLPPIASILSNVVPPKGTAGLLTITIGSEEHHVSLDIRVPEPEDPTHPYRGVKAVVADIARRANEAAARLDAGQ